MKNIRLCIVAGCLGLAAVAARASTFVERFADDPLQNGWQIFGNTNLFHWDSTNQVLDVTWDSTQPNSYFYHPLGVTLTTNDSFCVQFDLQLTNCVTTAYGMEISIGLLRFADATNADFNRANSPFPNLCEFDYFPPYVDPFTETPYGGSANVTLKDSQSGYAGLYAAYDGVTMDPTVTYRIVLIYRAGEEGVTGVVYTNGVVASTLPFSYGSPPFSDFQLDTLSVSCFADDGYGDSVYAQGTVANIAVASPLPVDTIQAPAAGQVQFGSDPNWRYTLEGTTDFQTWTQAAASVMGNGANLVLQATNAPTAGSFYRVRAELP